MWQFFFCFFVVLIETSWNVKLKDVVEALEMPERINRNIVECKATHAAGILAGIQKY